MDFFYPGVKLLQFSQPQILSHMGITPPTVHISTSFLTQHKSAHTIVGKNFLFPYILQNDCLH